MIRGQSEVTWVSVILTKITRKHKNTELVTAGEKGTIFKDSDKRSAINVVISNIEIIDVILSITLNLGHLLLILIDV